MENSGIHLADLIEEGRFCFTLLWHIVLADKPMEALTNYNVVLVHEAAGL